VVGGFFEGTKPVAPNAVLGVVAAGTGSDFGRTIEQVSLESACEKLGGRNTRTIDVGFASFTGNDGASRTDIFINVASFGCSGVVARLVSPRLKSLSGSLAFWLATIRALAVYRDQTVTLKFDDQPPRSLPITNCAFANGRYFGAGMQVAPSAKLDDGKLDVTLWSGFGVLDFVRLRGAIRDGSHVKVPGTEVLQTRSVTASSSFEVWLELDGESVGKLPARVEILPSTVRLKI
jgi:diacylglycerol kinase family enzyme